MYEYGLTRKQDFFLTIWQRLPNLDLIGRLWVIYTKAEEGDTLLYHQRVSPFRPHPCGDNSIFHKVGGFIDIDMFHMYYQERKNWLTSIMVIGHPYFICQFTKTKAFLEESEHYYDVLINQEQIKLTPLQKLRVWERVIDHLLVTGYNEAILEGIVLYLYSFMLTYTNIRVACHPIGIDCEGQLCTFE
jgi:hypothetical protein